MRVALECGHARDVNDGVARLLVAGTIKHQWCDHPDCECHRLVIKPGTAGRLSARDELDLHLLATQGRILGEKPWTDGGPLTT